MSAQREPWLAPPGGRLRHSSHWGWSIADRLWFVRGNVLGPNSLLTEFLQGVRDHLAQDHEQFLSMSAPHASDADVQLQVCRYFAVCEALAEHRGTRVRRLAVTSPPRSGTGAELMALHGIDAAAIVAAALAMVVAADGSGEAKE